MSVGGASSSIKRNKLVIDGTIIKNMQINALCSKANIKNKNQRITINSSSLILKNRDYNRFNSLKPTVVYNYLLFK